MKHKSAVTILFIFIVIQALVCSCSDKNDGVVKKQTLFNTETFFISESERLPVSVRAISKTMRTQGTNETKHLSVPDWKKLLEPFIRCNIDKPALRNEYSIDTISGSTVCINYTANNSSLAVRKLSVTYLDDQVKRVQINTSHENFLYKLTQKLNYIPDSGFSIQSEQKIIFKSPESILISASWQ